MAERTPKSEIAQRVLLRGLQGWGQSVDERVGVWQAACDFMKLSVTVGTAKHGGRLHYTFDGLDAEQANQFVTEVTSRFPLGKFEREQAMIEECLDKYKND